MLVAWLGVGLLSMVGPGVLVGLLGALGLVLTPLPAFGSAEWIRLHAHAQIFGWIGSFVWGISLFVVPRMLDVHLRMPRAWTALVLWTAGLALFFSASITGYRLTEPVGLALQTVAAFIVVTEIVPLVRRRYRNAHACMPLVASGLWILALSVALETWRSFEGVGLTIPAAPDRTTTLLVTLWGGLATTTWGYAARWLPATLNLRPPRARLWFLIALSQWISVISWLSGQQEIAAILTVAAAVTFCFAVRVFEPLAGEPRIRGVHSSFPHFVRLAHGWMVLAAITASVALVSPVPSWPSTSRHLFTVGYLVSMIVAIGPRMLPAFIGHIRLFSRGLMGTSMSAIALGCTLRVANVIATPDAPQSWFVFFASLEVLGLFLFVANALGTMVAVPTVQENLTARAQNG